MDDEYLVGNVPGKILWKLLRMRKRLAEKCPDVRLVPVSRGRFQLRLECAAELVER